MQDRTLLDLNLLEQSQNLSHRANQLRFFFFTYFRLQKPDNETKHSWSNSVQYPCYLKMTTTTRLCEEVATDSVVNELCVRRSENCLRQAISSTCRTLSRSSHRLSQGEHFFEGSFDPSLCALRGKLWLEYSFLRSKQASQPS